MGFTIVNSLPEMMWRAYLLSHPHSNIFHTPEMYAAFAQAVGHRPMLWAAVDGRGCPHALMITVTITIHRGVLKPWTTRAVAYGGVLASSPEALTDLLAAYRRTTDGLLFTELRHLHDAAEWQLPLLANEFNYEPHLNYLIDLSHGPEAVLAGFQKRLRSTVRQAERAGDVRLVRVTDRAQLAEVHALLQKTYTAARIPLADRSLFEAVFDQLHFTGQVWFTLAYAGDRAVACSVELAYKQVVYAWYGGLDRAARGNGVNEWMLAAIMQEGACAGYQVYDFGGAGHPDRPYPVRDFKAKFGGELVNYGRNTCVHSPLILTMSRAGFDLYQRWLSIRERRK